jgi:hypothetical protein
VKRMTPRSREGIPGRGMEKGLASYGAGGIFGNFTARVDAGVAQSAEHRFCKPTVVSSTLTASSGAAATRRAAQGRERSRGRGPFTGWIPKWPKGPDCKSGGTAFAGSNPAPPITPASPLRGTETGVNAGPTGQAPQAALTQEHDPGNGRDTRRTDNPAPTPATGPPSPRKGTGSAGGCNSMVEYLPSKQATWVRFPSPALGEG